MVIFVTGGAKSGKSCFAQALAEGLKGRRLFLATAKPLDEEMMIRIEKHREDRGDRWDTKEEEVYIGKAVRSLIDTYDIILVDCLTVWISNLLCGYTDQEESISEIIEYFFLSIDEFKGTIIIVSNEVGAGIVPDNRLARIYRDQLGLLNQRMAKRADQVYLLVSGIPVKIKS